MHGRPRFTFGNRELLDGLGFVVVAMGLFGVAEILLSARSRESRSPDAAPSLVPSRADLRAQRPRSLGARASGSFWARPGHERDGADHHVLRGEKRLSRTPERFGTG